MSGRLPPPHVGSREPGAAPHASSATGPSPVAAPGGPPGAAAGAPHLPPPWRLSGDAWAALLWLPGPRLGRVGALVFIRYAASNVGPYDELLWLAPWGLAESGRRSHTVERIFVSSAASREGGRRNWGIPKELAELDVSQVGVGGGGDAVEVRARAGGRELAALRFTAGRRALGADSRRLPQRLLRLVQVLDGQRFEVAPRVRGRLRAARLERVSADPSGFVDLSRARVLGAVALSGFEMVFPAASVSPAR